ncbi:MAG: hypothetical protein AABY22_01500 [Nanoarchaeota archaeon]
MIARILPNGTTEIDLSDENISISKKIDILKRLLNNEIIIRRRKAKLMYSKKYPPEMYSFVRTNIKNMRNKELMQSIKKKFGIDLIYSQLNAYINYNKISRRGV